MAEQVKLYSVHDPLFAQFGKVIDNPFGEFLSEQAEKVEIPAAGSAYKAALPEFETPWVLAYYKEYFGELDVQIGYCWGRNNTLNALEWHKNSEINVALADMILLLGDYKDMKNDTFDSADLKAFLVRKGEAVEVYQTALHFCPMMTDGKVFKCVVILPRGTNTPLDNVPADKKLIAKNKWLICHPDCKRLTDAGRVVGITGKNITID